MPPQYKYPLQTDPFTVWDRLKVSWFILNKNNKLTFGPKVETLEHIWKNIAIDSISGSSVKTLATSSGSTANHLLVETFLQTYGEDPTKCVVFVPATTWASSVSPWIMRGFKIRYVDIDLNDLCMSRYDLAYRLKQEAPDSVKIIWPTALIGCLPKINHIKTLADKHDAYLFGDLCEASLGSYGCQSVLQLFDMATTSFFWAHQITSIEGGMLFINAIGERAEDLYENARMIRNHGLIRSLDPQNATRKSITQANPEIDEQFLFAKIGTNYRMSDLHAYFGILDSRKIAGYIKRRVSLWNIVEGAMSDRGFHIPEYMKTSGFVPFCIPIIAPGKSELILKIKQAVNKAGWETRPIISFLPLSPAFRVPNAKTEFPNSNSLHKDGFYVGLNSDLKAKDIRALIKIIDRVLDSELI